MANKKRGSNQNVKIEEESPAVELEKELTPGRVGKDAAGRPEPADASLDTDAQASDAPEQDPLAELEEKLETAKSEARQSYDRFLRVSAEFENYKKRASREATEFRKFANESLLRELLSVVDNLERALASAKETTPSEKGLRQGVDMTLKEILKILEKFSVKQIIAMGEPFDPNFHQAVQQEKSDEHPENTVVQEFQKGYLFHDRLLRAAMVVVSKKSGKSKS